MKIFTIKSNAARDARRILGDKAERHVDFAIIEVDGGFTWEQIVKDKAAEAKAQAELEEMCRVEPNPAVADYASDRVFDGVRPVPPTVTAALKTKRDATKKSKVPKAPKAAKAAKPTRPAKPAKAPRTNHAAELDKLLRRPKGATAAEVQAVTGWLPHTARARISTTYRGCVTRTNEEGRGNVYRVVE